MPCNHTELTEILEKIEFFQGSGQRHVCAGCAYNLGLEHRKQGRPFDPGSVDHRLPSSQGGPQRHRNAYQAYEVGYYGR